MVKEQGFLHGADLLVGFKEKDATGESVWLGHSKTCTISSKSETKSRMHKDLANAGGKWDEKTVSKQNVSISAEGFVCYQDKENGYSKLLTLWEKAEPILVCYGIRGDNENHFEGEFIIVSLEEVGSAEDDATYSISLENSGPVTRKETTQETPEETQG